MVQLSTRQTSELIWHGDVSNAFFSIPVVVWDIYPKLSVLLSAALLSIRGSRKRILIMTTIAMENFIGPPEAHPLD